MFIVKNKTVELFSKIAINEDGLLLLPIFNNDNLFNVLFLKIDEQKGELNWFEDRHWLLEGEPNAESYFFSLIIDFNKKKLATTAFLEHVPTEDIYSVYSFEKNEVVSLGDVHVSNSECSPKVDSDTLDLQKMFLCIGDHVF